MATIYSHKDSNIRKTWLLITVFLALIIAFGWFLSYWFKNPGILYIAVIFSVGMSFASYWWSDKLVLAMSHATEVKKEAAPELYRIVENLSITAGLPVPKVYIIEERAMNAFATGRNPQHAVVAVTRGLLERLDRVELEGVLAHEMSHIGNRDMLLSTVIVVLAGIIVIAADFMMRHMLWGGLSGGRRDSRGSGQAHAIIMVIGLVVMIVAPILAQIIKLAISRKREFLADASGALLTRYPEGLARALEKISQDSVQISVANNATAHLFFENPFKGDRRHGEGVSWFARLFMTHPPVEERVKALRGINTE